MDLYTEWRAGVVTCVRGACPRGMGFEFLLVLDRCGSGGSLVGGLSRMESGGLSFLERGCTMVPVEFSSRMKLALALGHVPPFLESLCDSLFFLRERFSTLLVSLTVKTKIKISSQDKKIHNLTFG